MKKILIPILLVVLTITAVFFIKKTNKHVNQFYGTVELNYIDLGFVESERIKDIYFKEGDFVKRGDKLAELDVTRLVIKMNEAIAERDALLNIYKKLQSGYLPDEIEKAKANSRLAKAQFDLSEIEYKRQLNIFKDASISKKDMDIVYTSMIVAKENSNKADIELRLMQQGYRKEDIDQAKAKVTSAETKISMLERQIADSTLTAPVEGYISNKLLDTGELALPQKPVLRLSIVSPLWIRGYISEPELGRISLNQQVQIFTDSYPEPIIGNISYIANSAEFTPKTVQTEELRPSLVYKVKVIVENAAYLKQGMPVTVKY